MNTLANPTKMFIKLIKEKPPPEETIETKEKDIEYQKGFKDGYEHYKELQAFWATQCYKDENDIPCPSMYSSINDCISEGRYKEEFANYYGEYEGKIISECIEIMEQIMLKEKMKIGFDSMRYNIMAILNVIESIVSLSLYDRIKEREREKRVLDSKLIQYGNTMNDDDGVLCDGGGDMKQEESPSRDDGSLKTNGEGMDGGDVYWDI